MRTFILGVGAQKAGTSWLFRQLEKHEKFKRPAVKEMHVFDAKYIEQCASFRERVEEELSKRLLKGRKAYENRFVTRKFHMLLDQEEYFRYFNELMDEDYCFSADITPTYAGLPVEVLKSIKHSFDKISVSLRVVFLMREPVTRLDSAVRMNFRNNGDLISTTNNKMMKKLSASVQSPGDILRSSYRKTVNNLYESFGEKDVYLGFYETMFSDKEVDRLANFLMIDRSYFDTNQEVNKTETKFVYPGQFIDDIKSKYLDTYDFVANDLGFDLDLWDRALSKIKE